MEYIWVKRMKLGREFQFRYPDIHKSCAEALAQPVWAFWEPTLWLISHSHIKRTIPEIRNSLSRNFSIRPCELSPKIPRIQYFWWALDRSVRLFNNVATASLLSRQNGHAIPLAGERSRRSWMGLTCRVARTPSSQLPQSEQWHRPYGETVVRHDVGNCSRIRQLMLCNTWRCCLSSSGYVGNVGVRERNHVRNIAEWVLAPCDISL